LDLRGYHPFLDTSDALVGALQIREASATSSTPLALKPGLGGLSTQRGLPRDRIITQHTATVRGELRGFPVHARVFDLPLRLGAGIFGEWGMAGDTFGRLFTTRGHPTWGLTFFGSYFTDDFVGRADIGFSPDGFSTYVGIGHAI
jgi:hypothetical protein